MWPPEALEFLGELEDNNDSEWFRRERHRYDQFLVAPARELADKLADLGAPRLFRPYNNLRFRPGPPLKEHLGLAIGYGAARPLVKWLAETVGPSTAASGRYDDRAARAARRP